MLLDIEEIPLEAARETLRDQIALRKAYLPRLTARELIAQMRAEVEQLEQRLARRGP
jgi:hypothetical protein